MYFPTSTIYLQLKYKATKMCHVYEKIKSMVLADVLLKTLKIKYINNQINNKNAVHLFNLFSL